MTESLTGQVRKGIKDAAAAAAQVRQAARDAAAAVQADRDAAQQQAEQEREATANG